MSPVSNKDIDSAAEQVLAEIAVCVRQTSGESLGCTCDMIESAPRVFVTGAGRSGLCMRAFGMRLMHLGKTVYIVGETTTPSIRSNDLLILGSGSGQSAVLVKIAELARQQGAKPPLFTAETISLLSELADYSVKIPAPTLRPTLAERSYAFLQQGAKGLVHGRIPNVSGDEIICRTEISKAPQLCNGNLVTSRLLNPV